MKNYSGSNNTFNLNIINMFIKREMAVVAVKRKNARTQPQNIPEMEDNQKRKKKQKCTTKTQTIFSFFFFTQK